MSEITVFGSAADVMRVIGQPLGTSDWLRIDQARIDRFADATGDHQWIHVDPEKAATGPFGATVAHGYLTVSLLSSFLPQIVDARMRMAVNYGCEKIRFPAPVRVGARIRGHGELLDAREIGEGVVQATIRVTVEINREAKPGCVADTIIRYYF